MTQREASRDRVVKVPISEIADADSPRSGGEDIEHVRLLASSGADLPPIIVHRPTMRVIDGMHRLGAARLRREQDVDVRFFDGNEAEAFVLAVRMNVAHGLPLSLTDRKAAAARIIASHPQWSDRMIASAAGIAAKTVALTRERCGGDDRSPLKARMGRDGRLRPVDAGQRRRVAAELMTEDPGLSLRQVAKAAGISPETARSVRRQLGQAAGGATDQPQDTDGGQAASGQATAQVRGGQEPAPPTAVRRHRVQRLAAEPTLRYSETGRALLRLLSAHAMSEADWSRIQDTIPPHCRNRVVQAAIDCSQAWQEFAVGLSEGT